jgi:formylmethanofuran dehydrogenase subunit B
MVNPALSTRQADASDENIVAPVTCPGCGLLCDDIAVAVKGTELQVRENACHKSADFFAQASAIQNSPRIAGQQTDLQTAIRKAASILRIAQQPLISGLGTEVYGMRAALELADMAGATLDHMNSEAGMRNVLAMQNSGWQTTTLTEVRNRADLVLIIGGDIVSRYPRFFERVIWNKESMFGQDIAARDIVCLGGPEIDTSAGISPRGIKPTTIPCHNGDLPSVIAALLALANGKDLHTETVAGIPVADLEHLVTRLAAAKYSVIVWAAADFDFPHADLTIHKLAELIAHFNHTTRCSGLPMGGSEGDTTANNVSSWISGYPVRNSFKRGYPEYDPHRFATRQQLDSGEADALVWISSFNPDRVPQEGNVPTIVIGHPAMKPMREPDVFIPVGIPGVDHAGIMFRSDSAVALPLMKLRTSSLPSLRQVLNGIRKALETR